MDVRRSSTPYVFREYPKHVTGPAGPVIVHGAEEEWAVLGIPENNSTPASSGEENLTKPNIAADTPRGAGQPGARSSVAVSAWQPGLPVLTSQDFADWKAWSRERILTLQRERRRRMRRIDYYPSKQVAAIVDGLRTHRAGGDCSSIIDRIIGEWAAASGIK